MTNIEYIKYSLGTKYVNESHEVSSMALTNPSPRERITIMYTQDKTWEVCLSGEFLFKTGSTKDLIGGLKKLFKILE